jgi:2-dehydro-3-deoxyphosphooctonate aldolase (KDO 8-P synthase)
MSDGPNAFPLGHLGEMLQTLKALDALVKQQGCIEENVNLRSV